MGIKEIEEEIISEFELFGDDWEAKYEHIIDMGKSLKPMNDASKTDDKLIKGCQSRVWLDTHLEDGKVIYNADSDAIITKGVVAMIIRVLSGHTPQEIIEADMGFIEKIGLKENLSPTRANGLVSMIKQMKLDALALSKRN